MSESVSLREFGYNFCGPLIYTYVRNVIEKLGPSPRRVYHLAREGYLLKDAFDQVNTIHSSQYLLASRTFLFRILLDNPESWDFSLGHGFTGTVGEFFVSRYAFTLEQTKALVDESELEKSIELPRDKDYVSSILRTRQAIISDFISSSRTLYLEYLRKCGLLDESITPVFLDVGYSGTIQKLLTLLLGQRTEGVYFITTKAGTHSVAESEAAMQCVFKDAVRMGEGYTMLDRSMFIESLLTSPDGQFIDLLPAANNSGYIPCFGRRGYTQQHFEKLEQVHFGTVEAVKDYHEANVVFEVSELESLFSQYVHQRNLIPKSVWPLFEFDDAISGFGNVNPMQFFGL